MSTHPHPAARLAGALLAAAALGVGTAGAQSPPAKAYTNPALGPTANVGQFIGFTGPSSSWHGCRLVAMATNPFARPDLAGTFRRGNHQAAVTFRTSRQAPYVRWSARPGWRICGVQMFVAMASAADPAFRLGTVVYRSTRAGGASSPRGTEPLVIRVPRDQAPVDAGTGPVRYGIQQIIDVAVFVRRA